MKQRIVCAALWSAVCLAAGAGCAIIPITMNADVGTVSSSPLPLKAAVVISGKDKSLLYENFVVCLGGTARFPVGRELTRASQQAFPQVFERVDFSSSVPSEGEYDVVVQLKIFRSEVNPRCGGAQPVSATFVVEASLMDKSGQMVWTKQIEGEESEGGTPVSSIYRSAFEEYVGRVAADVMASAVRKTVKEILATPQFTQAKQLREDVTVGSSECAMRVGEGLAVLPFLSGAGDPRAKAAAAAMTESLTVDMINSRLVRVVERSKIDSVLREMQLAQTGLIDEKTAQSVGRVVGAAYVVIGNVDAVGSNTQIVARVLKVESGENIVAVRIGSSKADPLAAGRRVGMGLIKQLNDCISRGQQAGGVRK